MTDKHGIKIIKTATGWTMTITPSTLDLERDRGAVLHTLLRDVLSFRVPKISETPTINSVEDFLGYDAARCETSRKLWDRLCEAGLVHT
jgi:hypothetical protein